MVGPYGLSIKFYNLANNISKLDTGIVTTYAVYFTLAALTVISVIFAIYYLITLYLLKLD